jgi:hypothetical protein
MSWLSSRPNGPPERLAEYASLLWFPSGSNQRLTPSSDGGDDFVWVGHPLERFGVGVVVIETGAERRPWPARFATTQTATELSFLRLV